jgi:hypothetical protein
MDAWAFGDRLFLLDQSRGLWLVPVATGQLPDHQIDTYEHLVGGGPIEATPLGPGRKRTAFATDRGVVVVDEHGALVAMDSISGGEADEGRLVNPVPSEGYFVTVEAEVAPTDDTSPPFRLYILDSESGKLRTTRLLGGLEFPPRKLAVLDGHVLLTSGTNTVVYPAPVADAK